MKVNYEPSNSKRPYEDVVFDLAIHFVGFLVGGSLSTAIAVPLGTYLARDFPNSQPFISYGQTFFLGLIPFVALIGGISGILISAYLLKPRHSPILALWVIAVISILHTINSWDGNKASIYMSEAILLFPALIVCAVVTAIALLLEVSYLLSRRTRFSLNELFLFISFFCIGASIFSFFLPTETNSLKFAQLLLVLSIGLGIGVSCFLHWIYLNRARDDAKR